jgi:hypothetical protein
MSETFTPKQSFGVLLILVGGGCFLAAGMSHVRNVSDAIRLRNTKARRVFAAGGSEAHPKLNPVYKRQSRMFALVAVAFICFLLGWGLVTNP